MRAVIQRVSQASVRVDGQVVGEIQAGLLVLLGVAAGDTQQDLDYIYRKTVKLRVFEDEQGKMNLPLAAIDGQLLVVSQFTLYGDLRQGNRPGFTEAARPEEARQWYQAFVQRAEEDGITVATGQFQAEMQVSLINEGPVTLLLDSRKQF